MKKLLFAPADPQAFKTLQKALPTRQEWQGEIVALAEASAAVLAKTEWDAVVTDAEAESGRALLAQARRDFPEIARIGVVSQAKRTVAHLVVAQQIVPSFTDFGELDLAIERCCRLRDLLRGERICRTIGELGELPSAPGVYLELMGKLNGGDASVAEVAEIIEGDVGTSAKLLQVVNSAVFRTSREIATVKMAAGFLGLDVVKNVVLSVEAFQAFENLPAMAEFSFSSLQSHCRLTAAIVGQDGTLERSARWGGGCSAAARYRQTGAGIQSAGPLWAAACTSAIGGPAVVSRGRGVVGNHARGSRRVSAGTLGIADAGDRSDRLPPCASRCAATADGRDWGRVCGERAGTRNRRRDRETQLGQEISASLGRTGPPARMETDGPPKYCSAAIVASRPEIEANAR